VRARRKRALPIIARSRARGQPGPVFVKPVIRGGRRERLGGDGTTPVISSRPLHVVFGRRDVGRSLTGVIAGAWRRAALRRVYFRSESGQ